jgi:hypothetical protein
MKKIVLLIVSFYCFSTFIQAQGWEQLGTGTKALAANDMIRSVVTDNAGNVYAAGYFKNAQGFYYVAKWDGTSWSEVGEGDNKLNANSYIRKMIRDDAGNIYVAGDFRDVNGHRYVAKWNGTSWSVLGTGTNALKADDAIECIAVDKSGNVYAAGNFKMANVYLNYPYKVVKWDGTSWTALEIKDGTASNIRNIYSIAAADNGFVYIGGADRSLGIWDGTRWGYYSTSLNGEIVYWAMQFDHQGNLYLGGWFKDSYDKTCLAVWDGMGMYIPGTGSNSLNANNHVTSIAVDKDDNVYTAGYFTDENERHYVAKWNGTTWKTIGTGEQALNANGDILSVTTDHAGNVYAAGRFTDAAGGMYVAKWNNNAAMSVKNGENTIELILYPNPSAGTFCIRTSTPVQKVTLTNTLGQQEVFTSTENISSNFSGIVLVDVQTETGRAVKKLVIE